MDIVFVHGWSDVPRSMRRVADALKQDGLKFDPWYFGYRSQDDEATLADFAEGLNLWLQEKQLIPKATKEGEKIARDLHFVTHSTGALVVRRWMKQFAWSRAAEHVATITFLAPANFGSPLAHQGKSFLGHLAKGIREMRDFGETGRRTLEALELAAPEQWALADFDLFGDGGAVYGADKVRATVITGASGYGGLRSFVNEEGTDGTIVVAGAGLSCRKFSVDFASGSAYVDWISQKKKELSQVPFLVLAKPTHAAILELESDPDLLPNVRRSIESTPADYGALLKDFQAETDRQKLLPDGEGRPRGVYQQFFIRLFDDRDDPIPDYFIEFTAWKRSRIDPSGPFPCPKREKGKLPKRDPDEQQAATDLKRHFGEQAHTHSVDPSHRRFLVEPAKVDRILGDDFVLCLDVTANSGDDDIHYNTDIFASVLVYDPKRPGSISWIFPDTTTLIEMRVDRYTERLTELSREAGAGP